MLGLIAAFVLGAFVLIQWVTPGSSGASCDAPLAPLGTSELTSAGFAAEDAALGQIVSQLQVGQKDAAMAAFFGPTHNFMHNVDPVIRSRDPQLAVQVCRAVVALENDIASGASRLQIATGMEQVKELLKKAAGT